VSSSVHLLNPAQLRAALDVRDLSDPAAGPHVIQILTDRQKNLLVRVVLRDLETTLTNEAANALRDRIYLAIHQGTQYQWAPPAAAGGIFVA
jgi:hypothetical protein